MGSSMSGEAFFYSIVAVVALCFGLAWLVTRPVPREEGNRPASPEVLARREAARAEAWRQLEARLRGQDR
jgi:hypothetical protein